MFVESEVEGRPEVGVSVLLALSANVKESDIDGLPVEIESRPAARKSSTLSSLLSAPFLLNFVFVRLNALLNLDRFEARSPVFSSSLMVTEDQVEPHD